VKHAVLVALLLATAGLGAQQAPDRSKAPVTGPPPVLKLPPIQKRTLANGLPVWVVEMHEVPVAHIGVLVRAGAAADPAGKFGLANFTASMLDEGAGTRDALALADAVEFIGASLTTGSSYDIASIRMQTPVAKLDDALQILADVVMRPTFPEPELDRLRKERLTRLLQTRDQPAALATAAFSRLVFGPRHRYGTPNLGNEASNSEMRSSDLKAFYTSYYQPRNAHVLVVGDVTADAVVTKLEKALGGWKNAGAVPAPDLQAAPQHAARQIYLVDKPGAAQSEIRIGGVGVARRTPDYFVLDVLNTVLGGSFTSRLNNNLREQHGYAYGAGSGFDMRAAPGPFVASAAVQTDKTVESLQEFFKELDGMKKPVPADELAKAKNLETLGFPSGFETTTGMAGNLAELVIYGLPESFFAEYVPKIQAVTSADVERAAKQYLVTDKFAVVVVGDLAKIEKAIRELNLGPVRVIKLDEILK
jgi:predicted Zn-dependent peptidase